MPRLFVALDPPEEVKAALDRLCEGLPGVRWSDPQQFHLTLRFIGEVERPLADDIALALSRIRSAPFELRVAGVGLFERRTGGALWAGVEPKAPVAALAATLCPLPKAQPESETSTCG